VIGRFNHIRRCVDYNQFVMNPKFVYFYVLEDVYDEVDHRKVELVSTFKSAFDSCTDVPWQVSL